VKGHYYQRSNPPKFLLCFLNVTNLYENNKEPFLEFIKKLTDCELLTLVVTTEEQIKSADLQSDDKLNFVFVQKLEGKDAADFFLSQV
jgi:hypothetical protein